MLSMFRFRRRYTIFLLIAAVITILIFRYPHSDNLGQFEHTEALDIPETPRKVVHEGPAPPPKSPTPEVLDEKLKGEKKPPEGPKEAVHEGPAPPPKSPPSKTLDERPKEDGKLKEEEKPSDANNKPVIPVKEKTMTAGPAESSTVADIVVSDKASPQPAEDTTNKAVVDEHIHPVAPPGRQDFPTFKAVPTTIHWEKQSEHFPVPTESIIKLPTGVPVAIPKIQYAFKDEVPEAKIIREKRQAQVKKEFEKAWNGYKSRAWLHDELSPVSGEFRDPFCGWAATLVDALDTLWIMGLRDEFEEAAKAVDQIDFTTSPRNDIPVFETTIRYLGGLVGAYDVSGQKYKNILTKAEELATILMGAFDTPNRMPDLFYHWKPAFASQPHRASPGSNLAELGSLSVEFTRLAQLTKEPRYYDAVARITDALAEFQNRTKLPGVFPPAVDASGCNKTVPTVDLSPMEEPEGYKPVGSKTETSDPPKVVEEKSTGETSKGLKDLKDTVASSKDPSVDREESKTKTISKRAESPKNPISGLPADLSKAKSQIGESLGDWDCKKQGLDTSNPTGSNRFSMGGSQDSTYEYFPKEYLLLGGRVDMYRELYLNTMEPVRKHMLFRPMVPRNLDILFSGSVRTDGKPETKVELTAETEHLTCFIGGMVGMASKIFDIKGDLEIAKKLTDGCVWAYGSMPSDIMAESAVLMPCESMEKCTWNETAYYEYLDPRGAERDQKVEEYLRMKATEKAEQEKEAADTEAKALAEAAEKAKDESLAKTDAKLEVPKPKEESRSFSNSTSVSIQKRKPPSVDTQKPLSHKEYVDKQIERFQLPPGYVEIRSKNYVLRPEAIESVWYMYRITGDTSWQDKGWKMFEAVIKATSTEYGHSAVGDVTLDEPVPLDQMESFWLAETLKYFYLLFSTPDTISLDDWVLNTEAHPFKREVL